MLEKDLSESQGNFQWSFVERQLLESNNISALTDLMKSRQQMINVRIKVEIHPPSDSSIYGLTPLHFAVSSHETDPNSYYYHEINNISFFRELFNDNPEKNEQRKRLVLLLLSYKPDIEAEVPINYRRPLNPGDFEQSDERYEKMTPWQLAALVGRKDIALLILSTKPQVSVDELAIVEEFTNKYELYKHGEELANQRRKEKREEGEKKWLSKGFMDKFYGGQSSVSSAPRHQLGPIYGKSYHSDED